MEKHFVVKEHQANYTIGNLEPEDLFNFLNQSISIPLIHIFQFDD